MKESVELYVLLMANAVTISAAQLMEGIEVLRARPELDSAVTVSCYNMWSPLGLGGLGQGVAHEVGPGQGLVAAVGRILQGFAGQRSSVNMCSGGMLPLVRLRHLERTLAA